MITAVQFGPAPNPAVGTDNVIEALVKRDDFIVKHVKETLPQWDKDSFWTMLHESGAPDPDGTLQTDGKYVYAEYFLDARGDDDDTSAVIHQVVFSTNPADGAKPLNVLTKAWYKNRYKALQKSWGADSKTPIGKTGDKIIHLVNTGLEALTSFSPIMANSKLSAGGFD